MWKLVYIVLLVGVVGCAPSSSKKEKSDGTTAFKLPDIPDVLTDAEGRAEFLVLNYWANYDFSDTTLIHHPEITQQEFANFLALNGQVPPAMAAKAIKRLLEEASADSVMFAHFAFLMEKYLYDPNSPYRNEEMYIPALEYMANAPRTGNAFRERMRFRLDLALKNRPGMKAEDFVYTLADDTQRRLYEIDADYTLLFFNNPECEECQHIKDYIAASPTFSSAWGRRNPKSKRAKLAILAVYPDADIPAWKMADYPMGMINAYDAGERITKQRLYDLKAIPTLYLLDENKIVILKDVSIKTVEQCISEISL